MTTRKCLNNAIYAVIKSFVDNHFNGGGIYTGTLANEGVGLAPYHHYDAWIPRGCQWMNRMVIG